MFNYSRTNGWRNASIFLNFKINEIVLKKYFFGKIKNRNISVPSDCKELKHSLMDSSLRDASNGGHYMSLLSIDAELYTFYCFKIFVNNSSSIEARDMKLLPLDASCNDESNELKFIIL